MWLIARRVADVYTGLCAGHAADGGAFGPLAALLDEDAAYRGVRAVCARPAILERGARRRGRSPAA